MFTPQFEALLTFVEQYKPRFAGTPEGSFEVNRLTAKVATYYEKVRYMLDYREEHTIRRSAIERIIKRNFLLQGHAEENTEDFLKELISSQYVSQGVFTETHVAGVGEILRRYRTIIDQNNLSYSERMRILSFAASEIDLYFDEKSVDEAIVETFFVSVKDRIFPNVTVESTVLKEQIYCACHRALLRSDDEMLSFSLWRKYTAVYGTVPEAVQNKVSGLLKQIKTAVDSDVHWTIAQKLRNEAIYFSVIKGIIEHFRGESRQIFASALELDRHIELFLDYKYSRENVRIKQSGIRAVLYLFLTKMVVAIGVEVPYEYLFIYHSLIAIPKVPILTNIFFHPFLLFILTRGVETLGSKNTKLVISGVHGLINKETTTPIRVKIAPIFSGISLIVGILYWLLIVIVFGMIIGFLHALEFGVASIVFFVFFLALASYFAYRIRYNAQRWRVLVQESIPRMLMTLAIVPVVQAGQWLSQKFAAINVFVVFMDLVLETPFRIILNISDAFVNYVKEKSQEIY